MVRKKEHHGENGAWLKYFLFNLRPVIGIYHVMVENKSQRVRMAFLSLRLFLFAILVANLSVQIQAFELAPSAAYDIFMPSQEPKCVLILFGGYPETPAWVRREFPIEELADENGVAILYMAFNRKLWLEPTEKAQLIEIITDAIIEHTLPVKIYLGGFSSGGNVALLLANEMIRSEKSLDLGGVFAVDSPVDLLALFEISSRNVKRAFSDISVQESSRTVQNFNAFFGQGEARLKKYAQYSPYLSKTKDVQNLRALADTRIRLYTEPDVKWWQENRKNEYEDMNAYYIRKLAQALQTEFKQPRIELIETENKGYRSNGYRHPHSWSIVDKEDLFRWMLSD